MAVKQSLRRVGDQSCLVLDEERLRSMGIEDDGEVDVNFYGRIMVMAPVGTTERELRLALEMAMIIDENDELLRRLSE
jgi:hypothetical protein